MGNMELHLIKGTPYTRAEAEDRDLIVTHLALEFDLERAEQVKHKLDDMGIPFRQNLSVPRQLLTNSASKL